MKPDEYDPVPSPSGRYSTRRFCTTCEEILHGDYGLTGSQCRFCIAEDARRLAEKEAGFARLAYDQLVASRDQEIERVKGGLKAKHDAVIEILVGLDRRLSAARFTEMSTARHQLSIAISLLKE